MTMQKEDWSEEIKELEIFFSDIILPGEFILGNCMKLKNVKSFVKPHLEFVKRNNGNKTYLPYLERLRELKTSLK